MSIWFKRMLIQLNGCHWKVIKTLEFGKRFLVAYQGHEQQAFELAKSEGADGAATWTLRKTER